MTSWDRDLYASPFRHHEPKRADTSTRPLDHYQRCAWVGGHRSPRPAGVLIADIPYCVTHGIEKLAGILNHLPHAETYDAVVYEPDDYSELAAYTELGGYGS